jgi:hypothetical protein
MCLYQKRKLRRPILRLLKRSKMTAKARIPQLMAAKLPLLSTQYRLKMRSNRMDAAKDAVPAPGDAAGDLADAAKGFRTILSLTG